MNEREAVQVTLVRHGESEANRAGRWQGQGDSPLSELGRAQAGRLGERLRGQRYDRVIASDLQRASETARATGFGFEPDAAFRELDVGRWEGLTREEVNARFPEEIARLNRGEDVPLGGGESYAEFVARAETALGRACAEMAAGERLLIVCHGGVISALISAVLGIRERGQWPISRVRNTSLSELYWQPGSGQLRVFNDDLHLEGMPGSESDLHASHYEVAACAEGEDLAHLAARLTEVPAYRLPGPALAAGIEGVRRFETEADGAEALEAWLRYAEQTYTGAAARCLVAAEQLGAWLTTSLSLEVGPGGSLGQPRAGTWSGLRGGERPVLQRYNARV